MNKVKIDTETIKLDSFLKWCAAASSGAEAKIYIKNGMVKVNNEICTMRGKKLIAGDVVSLDNEEYEVVCLLK
ncbi:RNA-binding S4 domain-containing protein [Clostridium sp. BJN0001]|uniref:RNA-binding S4 domain-containing protein n=1 Tax=Clostridium sp. BJN0001 TaxID=2930219 RepID=UPI001FD41D49|nr:RNA-binding S4 domain-containing protein [Clostridium sp. BJN0001]